MMLAGTLGLAGLMPVPESIGDELPSGWLPVGLLPARFGNEVTLSKLPDGLMPVPDGWLPVGLLALRLGRPLFPFMLLLVGMFRTGLKPVWLDDEPAAGRALGGGLTWPVPDGFKNGLFEFMFA